MEHITLKELRKRKGFTQKKMAELLGYKGKSGYCQLEKGIVSMTVARAEKIALILNEDVMKIFFACRVHDGGTDAQTG